LRLALPQIHRSPEDPWWEDRIDEACGRGELVCLQVILERCNVAQCAPTILHRIAGGDWPASQEFRPESERAVKANALLDAGARLDTRDSWNKSTPLATACAAGRIEIVRLFLERGADPAEVDTEPWARPLAWAERKGHTEVAALLREVMQ
jgi:hypothetical protein